MRRGPACLTPIVRLQAQRNVAAFVSLAAKSLFHPKPERCQLQIASVDFHKWFCSLTISNAGKHRISYKDSTSNHDWRKDILQTRYSQFG